jgi:hypothetical protein
MRHIAGALVSILLIFGFNETAIADGGARFGWWPFGGKATQSTAADRAMPTALPPSGAQPLGSVPAEGATVTTSAMMPQVPTAQVTPHEPLPSYSPPGEAERRWLPHSPFANLAWPQIHMPEMSLPRPRLPRPQFWPRKSAAEEVRNAWVGKSLEPAKPSPLAAARNGARRVADSTRAAWHKTVDVLTPGDAAPASENFVQNDRQPPLWKRMFASDKPEPEGPRTVTELLGQDRLDL